MWYRVYVRKQCIARSMKYLNIFHCFRSYLISLTWETRMMQEKLSGKFGILEKNRFNNLLWTVFVFFFLPACLTFLIISIESIKLFCSSAYTSMFYTKTTSKWLWTNSVSEFYLYELKLFSAAATEFIIQFLQDL